MGYSTTGVALEVGVHDGTMNLWSPHCRLHIGDVKYPLGGGFGPRIQHNLQLVYVWNGELAVWIDGAKLAVKQGECILLFPHHRERFRFSSKPPAHHGWCEVVDVVFEPGMGERLGSLAGRSFRTPEAIGTLSREGLLLSTDSRWAAEAELQHLCAAIMFEFLRSAGIPNPAEPALSGRTLPATLTRALDLIHQEHARLQNISQLAARAGVSQQHLSRLFREYVEQTPSSYLWQVRTGRAADLVKASGLSLAEIARQTGFKTQFHMSRRIRSAYGMAPQQMRAASPADVDPSL